MIISIIAVLFTFGLVIFLHEFGHFIVCKLSGIRVEAFSFGFGKELWGKTGGYTRYSVRLIPLGGYVKPQGEDINEYKGEPQEYFSKPWYIRLAVVLAGPFMNYLLAFSLFFAVIFFVGQPVPSDQPVIGDMALNYPAHNAGLKEKDRIISINGKEVSTWLSMAGVIHKSLNKEMKIAYEREGVRKEVAITPVKDPAGRQGIIGISPDVAYKNVSLFRASGMALHQCWFWTSFTITTLAGNIYRMEKPDVAGPIGIVGIVSKAAHSGFSDFIFLLGLISVAVGFFNLLPIPLLDGGHVILYLFEGIFRRKITTNIMRYVNSAGIVILLSIMVFATYSDIMRIWKSKSAKNASPVETVAETGRGEKK
ncbi:MAG: hypothetical protein COT17_06945 [Elusimicrobia bacterium CG08_land_8_20_14_0_20_51_18]|nr:MAG: hypothetical protein COT17_06945 [Elusimicrobia bacterium CG08_land_8_20_14_0_20_51_18]